MINHTKRAQHLLLAVFVLATTVLLPSYGIDNFAITQIDSSRLLQDGSINVYVRAAQGEIHEDTFSVVETTTGRQELEILDVQQNVNLSEGIDFILLIDNSGSMYDLAADGRNKMEHAREAAEAFISQLADSNDRIGIFSFNTSVRELSSLSGELRPASMGLELIAEPAENQSYTELYAAIIQTASQFGAIGGRKAILVLSDGESFPYFENSGNAHPRWEDKTFLPVEVSDALIVNSVGLYAINFDTTGDASLDSLVSTTGGVSYDAYSSTEISNVYAEIRDQIQSEYRLRIKAPAYNSSYRQLELSDGQSTISRDYYVPLLFGGGSVATLVLIAIFLLAGISTMVVLYILSFQGPITNAQIQNINGGATVVLNADSTVIGSSPSAGLTIAGNPAISDEHATIVHDDKKDSFTLVSKKTVRVNNKAVKNRELKTGDVIRIEDATIVFNAPSSNDGDN